VSVLMILSDLERRDAGGNLFQANLPNYARALLLLLLLLLPFDLMRTNSAR